MSNTDTCVVCGRRSSRASWNNNINTTLGTGFTTAYVACDFHSLLEFEAAIQAIGTPVTGNGAVNVDPAMTESPQA